MARRDADRPVAAAAPPRSCLQHACQEGLAGAASCARLTELLFDTFGTPSPSGAGEWSEEKDMPPPTKGTLFPLPVRGGEQAAGTRVLRDVADALDGALEVLAQLQISVYWSAREWSVASMPLRARLPTAEERLRYLEQVELTDWPDTGWALALDESRADAEMALDCISGALATLLREGSSPEERVWWSRRFAEGRDAALGALERMQELIAAWTLKSGADY